MEIQVTRATSATFYGSMKLSDLREFMDAVKDCKATATVRIGHYDSRDPREQSSTTITVNDA